MIFNSRKVISTVKKVENEIKTGDGFVNENLKTDIKASEVLKRGRDFLEERKVKPCSNRSRFSAKYDESKRGIKSTVLQESNKTSKIGTITCRIFEGTSNSNRSATNPRIATPPKPSKVTSEASLDYGVRKLVNRAVDKDSLSNCSRQLEVRKIHASRLPRSLKTAKDLSQGKSYSVSSKMNETGKETPTNPGCKSEILRVEEPESTKIIDTSLGLRSNDTKTESSTKICCRPNNNLSSKSSPTRIPALVARTPSSTRGKTAASKVLLPRINRDSFCDGKDKVQSPENRGEGRTTEFDGKNSRPGDKVSSKISIADTVLPQDSGDKETGVKLEKPVTRPLSEFCDLPSCENDAKNGSTSVKTKLPKSRTPLIVPKLMNEFRLLDKKQGEVSERSSRDLPVLDSSLSFNLGTEKSKTESHVKPCSSSEVLSREISERLGRVSDHLQEALDSGIPLANSVGESTKVKRRDIRNERSRPREVGDVKVQSKTKFVETKIMPRSKATLQSSTSPSGVCKSRELKPKPSSFVRTPVNRNPVPPPPVGSKVPRPVVAKRVPRKEIVPVQNSSTAKTRLQKQVEQEMSKNSDKSEGRKEVRPSSQPPTKPIEPLNVESAELSETSVSLDEDSDEDVIPIMNPAFYNRPPIFPCDNRAKNLDNVSPSNTIHDRVKLESWINGHEQAYLKGRAIGIKVASMARAAKEIPKRELTKTSVKTNTVKPRPNKYQEIVEIGVSLIEKVNAEKENKNHAASVCGDQLSDYFDFHRNLKWNNKQLFI